jgi:hypothetical protein
MKTPEVRLDTRVTTATGTSIVLTPTTEGWDAQAGGVLTTITLAGTGFTGVAVGDRLHVGVSTA